MKRLTAKGVYAMAIRRKAVIIPSINSKRMPAAFLISMPFYLVMRYISNGVYEYKKKS